METKCKTCNHEQICTYCAEHLEEFSLPDENGTCDLFDPRLASPFADTVEGMLSPDYKERFKAEYAQTKIRYERLKAFNTKIEAAHRTMDMGGCRCVNPVEASSKLERMMPKHDCPDDLLREQQSIMGQYLHLLEVRAVIEGIDLK